MRDEVKRVGCETIAAVGEYIGRDVFDRIAYTPPPATATDRRAATRTVHPTTLKWPPAAAGTKTPTGPVGETATVERILGGDTIDGQVIVVRYLGIDTPVSDEACATEATQANVGLVHGHTVTLVEDVSEMDRHDWLLRYVYAGDLFVTAEPVRQR